MSRINPNLTLDGYEDIYQLIEKGEGSASLDKLKEVHDGLINMNVVNFPVIMLEELTAMVHSAFFWLTSFEPLSLLL